MKISILPITVAATADVLAGQLVGFNGAPAGVGTSVLGVAAFDAKAGQDLTVDTIGLHFLKAGGAIALGDLVAAGANGLPVTTADAALAFGRALTAAGVAGETVKIITL